MICINSACLRQSYHLLMRVLFLALLITVFANARQSHRGTALVLLN